MIEVVGRRIQDAYNVWVWVVNMHFLLKLVVVGKQFYFVPIVRHGTCLVVTDSRKENNNKFKHLLDLVENPIAYLVEIQICSTSDLPATFAASMADAFKVPIVYYVLGYELHHNRRRGA